MNEIKEKADAILKNQKKINGLLDKYFVLVKQIQKNPTIKTVDEVKSDINALLGQMHNDMLVNGSAWDELIHMMNSTPRNQTYKQIEPYLFSLESDLLKNSRYRLKFHQEFTKEGARGDVYLNQLLKGVTMLLSMETDGFFGRSSVELASFYINIETMTVTGAYPKDIKHDQLKKILALFFELLEKKCNFKINIT